MDGKYAPLGDRGMYRDVAISKTPDGYAFENVNVRIVPEEGDTMLSVVSERSPKEMRSDVRMKGHVVGACEAGDMLVLFTAGEDVDGIYRLSKDGEGVRVRTICECGLGFEEGRPVTSLYDYESADIRKVYWTDGTAPTRFVNLSDYGLDALDELYPGGVTSDAFEFRKPIGGLPTLEVSRRDDGTGSWKGGTVSWYLTMYDRYGAETAIAAETSLMYVSPSGRGAKEDETCGCSFSITASGIPDGFGRARLYSARRSSLDGPVTLVLVADVEVDGGGFTVIDTNRNVTSMDPSLLYYIGGSMFTAGALEAKDGVLFQGNIDPTAGDLPKDYADGLFKALTDTSTGETICSAVSFSYVDSGLEYGGVTYSYEPSLDKGRDEITHFKGGELYRFGIQFRSASGNWTSAVWIGDARCDMYPKNEGGRTYVPTAVFTWPDGLAAPESFGVYRILAAEVTAAERSVLAQGVICPTVFNVGDRRGGSAWSASSWVMRPRGGKAGWDHLASTGSNTSDRCEIQTVDEDCAPIADGDMFSDGGRGNAYVAAIGFWKKGSTPRARLRLCYAKTDAADMETFALGDGKYEGETLDSGLDIDDDSKYSVIYDKFRKELAEYGLDMQGDLGVTLDIFKDMGGVFFSERVPVVQDTVRIKPDGDDDVTAIYRDNWYLTTKGGTQLAGKIYFGPLGKRYDVTGQYGTTGAEVIFSRFVKTDAAMGVMADVSSLRDRFYVDGAMVTMHSPDIQYGTAFTSGDGIKARIVGLVGIDSSFSDITMDCTAGSAASSGVSDSSSKGVSVGPSPLLSSFLYRDTSYSSYDKEKDKIEKGGGLVGFRTYMWNKQGSVPGFIPSSEETTYGELKEKLFANMLYSGGNVWFDSPKSMPAICRPEIVEDGDTSVHVVDTPDGMKYYCAGVDKLIVPALRDGYHCVSDDEATNEVLAQVEQHEPVRMKYKSSRHVVFSFGDDAGAREITPALNSDEAWSLKELYGQDTPDAVTYLWGGYGDGGTYSYLSGSSYVGGASQVNGMRVGGFGYATFPKDADPVIDFDTTVPEDFPWYGESFYILLTEKTGAVPSTFGWVGKMTWDKATSSYSYRSLPPLTKLDTRLQEFLEPGLYRLPKRADGTFYFSVPKLPGDGVMVSYGGGPAGGGRSGYVMFVDTAGAYMQESLGMDSPGKPYLYLVELYRDLDYGTLYGGTGDAALRVLNWRPVSQPVAVGSDVERMEGDTFLQRYDCLKTYPYVEGDENSVVDITSFMCETRTNIDGRCDVNRGTGGVLRARPSNFGLLNMAYSQESDLFNYATLDDGPAARKLEPSVTWSLPKTPVSDVDPWTGSALINTVDLDGRFGAVTCLSRLGGTLVAFQRKAVSVINFNERTQLTTTSGAPVELSSSGGVSGYTIVSSSYGCEGGHLTAKTAAGLWFIDSDTGHLMRMSGEGIEDVAMKGGFSSWFRNLAGKEGRRLSSDPSTGRVYFVGGDEGVLCYSEKLGAFESFYIWNTDGGIISPWDGIQVAALSSDGAPVLAELSAGDYGMDMSMTFRVNPEPMSDKIFTNIEFVADVVDGDVSLPSISTGRKPFDTVTLWNDYQRGSDTLEHLMDGLSNLKRKFRIWRLQLPRDEDDRRGIDRIRGTWVFVRLDSKADGLMRIFDSGGVLYFKP